MKVRDATHTTVRACRKTRSRPWLLSCATAAAILLIPAVEFASTARAQDLTRVPFTLNWKYYGIHGCIFLAEDRGYFAKEGLRVPIDTGEGSAIVVNRLASGAYEIGYGDIGSLVKYNAGNPEVPVRAVYAEAPSDLAILTLAKSGIKNPKALEGRTVGAPVGDSGYRMFPAFAKATGIDAQKIKWEHMAPHLRDAMLAQGKVDAITAFEQTAYMNLIAAGVDPKDIVVMPYADVGVRLINIGVMATQRMINERPKIVRGMVAAINKGFQDCLADPDAAMDALMKRDPLLKRDIEMQRFLINVRRMLNNPDFKEQGLGYYSKGFVERSVEIIAAAENLPRKPSSNEIIDMQFLPPQVDRKVSETTIKRIMSQ